jgi:hypothetical protein
MPLRAAVARSDADPGADATGLARGPTRDDALRVVQDIRHARKAGLDQRKAQARERLMQLVEQIRLIRRLWAGDPRRTAEEIARIAQELKAVLQDYAAAAKASGETGALPTDAAAWFASCIPAAGRPAGEAAGPDAAASQEAVIQEGAMQPAGGQATAAAQACARPQISLPVVQDRDPSARAVQNNADRLFVGQAREMITVLQDWLSEARIKAQGAFKIRVRSDAALQDPALQDEPFKTADEEMARTARALRLLEADIRRDTPPPASLSVAQA